MRATVTSPTGPVRAPCPRTPPGTTAVVLESLSLALPVRADLRRVDIAKSPGRERVPCHHWHLPPWSVAVLVVEAVPDLWMTTVEILEASAEPPPRHGVLVSVAKRAAAHLAGKSESAQHPLPLSLTISGAPRCDRIPLPASLPSRLAQPARRLLRHLWHPLPQPLQPDAPD